MSVGIRPYQDGDLRRLIEITTEAFEPVSIDRNIENQLGGPINGHDWRWRKGKHIEDDVVRQREGVFVAEVNSTIVGYITTFSDSDTGVGLIPNLAVDAEYRGAGIGRKLIEFALDHFRSLGLRQRKGARRCDQKHHTQTRHLRECQRWRSLFLY